MPRAIADDGEAAPFSDVAGAQALSAERASSPAATRETDLVVAILREVEMKMGTIRLRTASPPITLESPGLFL
jgi:hypothetical protein